MKDMIEWFNCADKMPEDVLPIGERKSVRVLAAVRASNGSYKPVFTSRVRFAGKGGVTKWKWYKTYSGTITHWAEEIRLPSEITKSGK